MTRSPGAIMRKSAIALPTEPRRRRVRRSRVRGGLAPARCTWGGGAKRILQQVALSERRAASGRRYARGALQVLCLDIADEGSGREGLPGGALQQLLHGHLGAEAVHLRAQPAEEPR